ncbi:retrotransposable element tf2 155 kda protein type 1 [Lasallia pustulata]|uniref:Retrotransposable element tf2 155 kDa protein type 1 n=1 Tax=Lasallia pustulata TaxID=136370 RepID=A0A1W5CW91_9LECA|nr:retrotransposable element tf2 155 kda protein type 1 [Lasallia pustulata]
MSNLSITDHFIGLADLVTDMENYAVHMNSLCYDKKDNNVYDALPPKYHDFADIFQAAEKQSLPERAPHDHAIDLEPGQQPPFGKLYLMSPAELDVLKVYLNNAVKAGIICKLILPAAPPVMHLNDITIKNRYPLPLILDMLDRLQGAKKFTKLDCKDAYNRVRIKGGDEWKTAFRTWFGLFEYLAMPFGLTNAPATFQAFIDKALGEFLDITYVVYLDNILIFSKNKLDHEEHIRQEAFTSASLLRYFDENKPMRIETDASAFAIGGILIQQFKINGHLHWLPVAYYNKKLLDTETRYGMGEQELLANVEAMHHWQYYCQGARHPIVVLTYHANLVWFMTTLNLTRRQLKWAEKLAEYDFNVTYQEGKKNPADGLLRRPDYELPKASTTSTAAETV